MRSHFALRRWPSTMKGISSSTNPIAARDTAISRLRRATAATLLAATAVAGAIAGFAASTTANKAAAAENRRKDEGRCEDGDGELGTRAGGDDARELGLGAGQLRLVFISFFFFSSRRRSRRLRRRRSSSPAAHERPGAHRDSGARHDRRASDHRSRGDACRTRASRPRAPSPSTWPAAAFGTTPSSASSTARRVRRYLSARSSGTHFRSRFRPRRGPAGSSTRRWDVRCVSPATTARSCT